MVALIQYWGLWDLNPRPLDHEAKELSTIYTIQAIHYKVLKMKFWSGQFETLKLKWEESIINQKQLLNINHFIKVDVKWKVTKSSTKVKWSPRGRSIVPGGQAPIVDGRRVVKVRPGADTINLFGSGICTLKKRRNVIDEEIEAF